MENITKPTQPGIYHGIPANHYHQWEYASPSKSKSALISAYDYKYGITNGKHFTQAQQDKLDLGSLIHSAILEPDSMLDRYVLWDGGARKGKEWESFKLAHETISKKIIILPKWLEVADGLRSFAYHHEPTREVMSDIHLIETSLLWNHKCTKSKKTIMCKGRPDAIGNHWLADVKSTASLSDRSRASTIYELGYDLSMAAYQAAYKQITGELLIPVLIWCRTTPPYQIIVKELGDEWIDRGWRVWIEALEVIAKAESTNNYPGISDEIGTEIMPAWANDPGGELTLTLDGESVGM